MRKINKVYGLSKARVSKRERGAQACYLHVGCVMGCVWRGSMEPTFIVVERDCCSLFVEAVIAFADNFQLVDN